MLAPVSSPALPSTTSSPPVMPRLLPGAAAPVRWPALPRTTMTPPDMPFAGGISGVAGDLETAAAKASPGTITDRAIDAHGSFRQPGTDALSQLQVAGERHGAIGRAFDREQVAQGHGAGARRPHLATGNVGSTGASPRRGEGWTKVDSAGRVARAGSVSVRSCARAAHDVAQLEVMRTELAAVVAGSDRHDAGTAGRVDPGAHRRTDRSRVEPVDDDLEHRVHGVR